MVGGIGVVGEKGGGCGLGVVGVMFVFFGDKGGG